MADIAKAQRLPNYATQTCLSSGLLKAIAWQRENGLLWPEGG